MPRIEWSERLNIGVAEIDEQHKRMIQLHNDLEEALAGGKAHRRMPVFLAELVEYAEEHFATEEALMEQVGYEGLDVHRSEHRQFLSKIDRFRKTVMSGRARVSKPLMSFLRYWFENHVAGTDREIASVLQSAGMESAP